MPTINQLTKRKRKSTARKTKSPAMTMTFNTLKNKPKKSKSPLLQIEEPFLTNLNSLFVNNWHKPFKIWFKKNFDVPVKTTMDELYNRRK